MSMKIKFNSFAITELSYRLLANGDESVSGVEEIEQNAKGRLAIHKDLENCIFELVSDIKTIVNDAEFRTLEISVQFVFDIERDKLIDMDIQQITKEIDHQFSTSILEFCKLQLSNIVRHITSVDYQPAIIIDNIEFGM
jgi:hypothetical protein